MPCCAAVGCKTRDFDKSVDPPITFHFFPNDPVERKKWKDAVRREQWEPTKASRICSKHFRPEDFDRSPFYTKLKKGAVPSLFIAFPDYINTNQSKVLRGSGSAQDGAREVSFKPLPSLGLEAVPVRPAVTPDTPRLRETSSLCGRSKDRLAHSTASLEKSSQTTREPEKTIVEQPPSQPPPKKLKLTTNNTAEELLNMAAEFFNNVESEWDVISKGWAIKMSKLAPDQRLYAEKIINDTLFEAQLGRLSRNGVRFINALEPNSH